ncbi:hypothetical protein ABEU97_20495 [Priestia megaterium]
MQLWEIFRDGKNGEIFEVVDCSVEGYLGMRVKVNAHSDITGDYKTIVQADADLESKDASKIVTIYGCLGTAEFKKVEYYREIAFEEMTKLIHSFRTVYVKQGEEYKQISKYTSFDDIDIDDLADLMNKTFYVKESK